MGAHPAQGPLPMRLEYVLDRYLAVCRLVDQSVVSLHQCACSLRGARDGAQRMLRQVARARHQTRAQARIAQRCAAELVRRPGLGVEPVAKRQRHARGHRQAFPPRRLQFIHIRPCASWPSHGCGPDDRAPRSHLRAPSSPPANSPRCARARQRTSPAARADSRNGARSPCPLPAPPDPGRAKPSCGKTPRGGSETGTVPPPGAVGCGAPCRPSQSRHRAPAGAARRPQSRRHPASRALSAVDGRPTAPRHAGARVPSACSQALRVALDQHQLQIPEPAHRGRHRARRRHRLRQHPRLAQRHGAAAVAAQLGPLLPARPAWRQLARCNRPRPSRKSNASQTRSATRPTLSTPRPAPRAGGQDWPACPLSDSEPACRLR